MQSTDLYVQISDPTGRHAPIVSHHRVHDEAKFLASLRKQYEQCDNAADRRTVNKTSQAEYRRANGYKPEHCQ